MGQGAGVFGLSGEVKIEQLTDYPDRFAPGRIVYLGSDRQAFEIERSRLHKSNVVVKFATVNSATDAESLRGLEACVPVTEKKALAPGEYLLADPIGIDVQTSSGREIGRISDVLRTGSNDVYVVGSGRTAILIPGIRDAIVDIDLQHRKMIVEPWSVESAI